MSPRNEKQMDALKKTVILIILVTLMLVPTPGWLNDVCVLSALTHHFFHANWFHLSANSLAFWVAFPRGRRMSELILAWVLASISYAVTTDPVIGFSNILFAIAGLSAASASREYWKNPATWVFIAVMAAMAFLPMFSASTHIVAFVLGLLVGALRKNIKRATDDYKRITR